MDQFIFHLINQQWTSPALDLFMAALSDSTIWKPLFVVIGLCAVLFGGFRARAFVVCLVLSLLITDQVTGFLKSTINRHRPKHVDHVRMVQLQRTHPAFLTLFKKPTIRFSNLSDRNRSGPSFPSGHMTTNTIIAVFCTLFYRRWGWLYWFVSAAVGYSGLKQRSGYRCCYSRPYRDRWTERIRSAIPQSPAGRRHEPVPVILCPLTVSRHRRPVGRDRVSCYRYFQ